MRTKVYKPVIILLLLFLGFVALGISLYACDGWYRRGGVTLAEFLSFHQIKATVILLGLGLATWATCHMLWLLAGFGRRSPRKVQDHEA